MPLHDLQCEACGQVEERLLGIEEKNPECPACGGATKRVLGSPVVHEFREGWYEHIDRKPIYVSSKKQLKDECRKRNLTSIYAEEW